MTQYFIQLLCRRVLCVQYQYVSIEHYYSSMWDVLVEIRREFETWKLETIKRTAPYETCEVRDPVRQ